MRPLTRCASAVLFVLPFLLACGGGGGPSSPPPPLSGNQDTVLVSLGTSAAWHVTDSGDGFRYSGGAATSRDTTFFCHLNGIGDRVCANRTTAGTLETVGRIDFRPYSAARIKCRFGARSGDGSLVRPGSYGLIATIGSNVPGTPNLEVIRFSHPGIGPDSVDVSLENVLTYSEATLTIRFGGGFSAGNLFCDTGGAGPCGGWYEARLVDLTIVATKRP